MTKVLFLTLHRPNRSPSQRFRFEQYIPYLQENRINCSFSYLLNETDDKIFYSKGRFIKKFLIVLKSFFKRLKELKTINQYDIVFVQRECFMLGTSYFEKKIAKKDVRLIFDFDDAIWLQNVSEANKTFVWLKNPKKTAQIITYATTVFSGNQYLADYALNFNENVVIIPTTIDTEEYQKIKHPENKKLVIGWSGSITTIQHFEFAIPFLKELKKKYPNQIEIKVIGDANYSNMELNIQGIAWDKKTEIESLSSFDIGIMPLPDDEWAKGKCGLKGLQYMSLEIPTVMSPVGVNTEIIENSENGFLANSNQEWIEKLSLLIESDTLRIKLGKAGRKTVMDSYSIASQKEHFLLSLLQT